jgi:DNA repair photolyase
MLVERSTTRLTPSGDAPAAGGSVVVRETPCRMILNRTSLGDYSLNCYTGCAHACAYCYARFMQRFHPHDEPWGAFVDVKVNAVEALKRQLRRAAPGEVFVSSACDGWQPVEAERRLTRRCCELLVEYGFRLSVLTKSRLVLRDLDVLASGDARLGVTLTTLDEPLAALWEPGAATVAERLDVLGRAREAGLRTAVMLGPLLPGLSDHRESIEALLAEAAQRGVERIWVDALNARPRVWPSVATLLRARFPELLEPVRRILFDRRRRAAYQAELGERVAAAASRVGVSQRVCPCF